MLGDILTTTQPGFIQSSEQTNDTSSSRIYILEMKKGKFKEILYLALGYVAS